MKNLPNGDSFVDADHHDFIMDPSYVGIERSPLPQPGHATVECVSVDWPSDQRGSERPQQ